MTPENITYLNIDLVEPNKEQPRKIFDDESLNELALSIKEYGILNPILVRKKDDKYEIIAGERRYRAAKKIGLTEIPVIIKNIEDIKAHEIALIENLHRENITPIEEAKEYEEILKKTNLTETELSKKIGKSQSFISNKLRLLSLPENIQNALLHKKISERHARSLMTVKNSERQSELLKRIIEEKLTVKELDNIINEKKITEEEIQSAINDIMKSLNMVDEEEKEEKESDKMNNENFFPNYNNNVEQNNANMSLNTMNMQTANSNMVAPPQMTQQPIPNYVVPEPPVVETPSVTPEFNFNQEQSMGFSNPTPYVPNPTPQVSDQPLFTNIESLNVAPQQENNTIQEQPEMMNGNIPVYEEPIQQPSAINNQTPVELIQNEIPSYGAYTENMEPPQEPVLQVPTPEPVLEVPQQEPPLFNQSLNSQVNQYEVPVENEPINMPVQDKFTEVTTLLQNNGVAYKAYSGENGSCIIIEL